MESLHYLLMKSHTLLNRKILSQAMKLGYSPGQPKVLEYLSKYEGLYVYLLIAAYCEIEQATVGSILLRMENTGLIERRQAPGNRRSLYVYLTDKGRQAARDIAEVFAQADKTAEASLSPDEVMQLKMLLEKISNTLNAEKEV